MIWQLLLYNRVIAYGGVLYKSAIERLKGIEKDKCG
jgi:hypothetical protein